jgi:flagellar biogenesis protein FliO
VADEAAPRYPERAAGPSAPGPFQHGDGARPLEPSRTPAERDRYPREADAARKATLHESRDVSPPRTGSHSTTARSGAAAEPLPISRPNAPRDTGDTATSNRAGPTSRTVGGHSSLVAVIGSLGVVLGLFFLVMWLLRRGMPKGSHTLPSEVVEVLGRTSLSSRQHAHLVRCGNKLLLVSLSAAGAETLTEVTDPIEVDRLAGLCRQSQPHSATATFRHIFQQFGRDGSARGFLNTAEQERAESLADADQESTERPMEEFHA